MHYYISAISSINLGYAQKYDYLLSHICILIIAHITYTIYPIGLNSFISLKLWQTTHEFGGAGGVGSNKPNFIGGWRKVPNWYVWDIYVQIYYTYINTIYTYICIFAIAHWSGRVEIKFMLWHTPWSDNFWHNVRAALRFAISCRNTKFQLQICVWWHHLESVCVCRGLCFELWPHLEVVNIERNALETRMCDGH